MVRVAPVGTCRGLARVWFCGGQTQVTVVVKATFALTSDGVVSLVEPQPLTQADHHHGSEQQSSARQPADVALYKPQADVVLVGCAHTPPGRAAIRCSVRLSLVRGNQVLLNKTLEVRGDELDGVPQPFERMLLTYERAYGGPSCAENPVGRGAEGGGKPNIVFRNAETRPAGFGPIAESWAERSSRRGELSAADLRRDLVEIPSDFDWSYFQASPEDQRTVYLVGDETILLDGLVPTGGHAEYRLPNARAVGAMFVPGPQGPQRALLSFFADTLVIEPDEQRASIVWRSAFAVPQVAGLSSAVVAVGVAVEGSPVVLPEQPPPVETAPDGPMGDLSTTVAMSPDAIVPTHQAPFELAEGRGAPSASPSAPPPWAEPRAQQVKAPDPAQASTLFVASDERGLPQPVDVLATVGFSPQGTTSQKTTTAAARKGLPFKRPKKPSTRPPSPSTAPAGLPWAGDGVAVLPPKPGQEMTMVPHEPEPVVASAPPASPTSQPPGPSVEPPPPAPEPAPAAEPPPAPEPAPAAEPPKEPVIPERWRRSEAPEPPPQPAPEQPRRPRGPPRAKVKALASKLYGGLGGIKKKKKD